MIDVATRLAAARTLRTEADGRLPTEVLAELDAVVGRAESRLAITGDATVVALAGPTGVGKSSLTNALLGVDVARVGVVRPTTSEPTAVAVGTAPPTALLAHLGLRSCEVVPVTDAGVDRTGLEGLLLVDLPDHDSVRTAHRDRAADLVATADRLLWVVDPEKYADASVHDDLLVPLREHAGVLTIVCNRLDRVEAHDRARLLDHLREVLRSRGMGEVEVVGTSTTDGSGLDELRRLLATTVADHRAAARRAEADLRALATELAPHVPTATSARTSGRADDGALVTAAATACGIPAVLDAVAATHLHRARRATGWPVSRRLRARGRDPLARLGLGRTRDRGEVGTRSSRGQPQGVAVAGLSSALRAELHAVAASWPEGWRAPVAASLERASTELPVALDRAVAAADLDDDHRPIWWAVVGSLQTLLATAMLVGLTWLAATAVVAWLSLPPLPEVEVGALSLPLVLAVGGALVGVLVATLVVPFARVGAARARRRVRRRLETAVRDVVDSRVASALADERDRATRAAEALATMRGS